jgi:hypothetical protein
MSDTTKILTVSYGTFSCTLEGFDDPLGSMRDIAEYFRDLAADDRYFGAEPPTPDVEMLQRIAEKEVQRRVDARVSDSGVALVAAPTEAANAPAPAAPAPATPQPQAAAEPTDMTAAHGPLTYDDEFTMADEPEDVWTVDPKAASPSDGPAESVAEKLRRIRAVVSKNINVDPVAARREQSPNADDPALRSRAQTETIDQISSDLADFDDYEDDADFDGSIAEFAEKATPAAEPDAVQAQGALAQDEAASLDDGRADENWEFEPELLGDTASDDADLDADGDDQRPISQRTDSRVVSDVLDKLTLAKENAVDDSAPVAPTASGTSRTLDAGPEDSVGRLLDETDTKLNDNETVRRRRVISQMRAAVAATKADRLVAKPVSKDVAEEAEKNPYREDLSEAVQDDPLPQTTRRPTGPPLVLVSSQRVATPAESAPTPSAGLEGFATNIGAKGLPELMEAAAAYAVFSEGQPSFTRPEIMKMVAQMDPSMQLSREESLRSFGQLLRQGTFKKLERGQFTIDQGTRFNPALRSATP